MVFFDGFVGLLFLGVWIFCIIDVITTPNGQARNLPKLAWLLIVILLADVGSLAWLLAGRPWGEKTGRSAPVTRRPAANRVPSADRAPTSPDDDEEFLASLRARAEEQRRRAREAESPDESGGPGS